MLSESQERMLVVVQKGYEEEVSAIFEKWDLHAAIIGEVTGGDRLVVSHGSTIVADVPASSLTLGGGAPVYIREARQPSYLEKTRSFDVRSVPQIKDCRQLLLELLGSPNIANKRWVYRQYDHMVRTSNMILMEGDAGVVLLKNSRKAISLKTDCNARYVYLNPYRGGAIAVAESARNVVCTGATPIAITNCLNFGNPYNPEIYWQFKEAVRGIGDACRALETPVTGGNVSFYNESPNETVYPTPVIGMLGIIDDVSMVTSSSFKNQGDIIILLGENRGQVGGSEYLAKIHGCANGDPPTLDLDLERRVQLACLQAIAAGLVKSAHDCSDGGLAVALAECCVMDTEHGNRGARVKVDLQGIREDFVLFGEDQSRIVITVDSKDVSMMRDIAVSRSVPMTILGQVGGNNLEIGDLIMVPLSVLSDVYCNTLEKVLEV
jgi:phosphoribosylformylglycinamidine synthase